MSLFCEKQRTPASDSLSNSHQEAFCLWGKGVRNYMNTRCFATSDADILA